MSTDQDSALRLVGEALGLAHRLADVDQITVRGVTLVDDSLTVEVLATSDDPVLLRGQAAAVMGGLSGLDVAEMFPELRFKNYAVRLVERGGDDLLWVITAPEDARFAETGSVRWLANSVFQDNSPSYRRAQADRLIGQIEVGLRDLLEDHWSDAHGPGYATTVFTETLLKQLRKSARKEGEDATDDRTLLNYTLLPQLAGSVCTETLLTTHGCVPDAAKAKESLARVNKVRRKVAHHREVTQRDLDSLRSEGSVVLEPIGQLHPSLVVDFLTERWEQALDDLLKETRKGMQTADPTAAGSMPEVQRRRVAFDMFEQQLAAARRGLASLQVVVVPMTRRTVHDMAETAYQTLITALEDVTEAPRYPQLDVRAATEASNRHAEAMAEISDLGREIERVRVMEHSAE